MGESTQLLMCHVMHLYLQRSICLFKELDIHPGQAGLLWALNCKDQDHRGMAQKELAKHIGVKPPSITVMLKKLEAEVHNGSMGECPVKSRTWAMMPSAFPPYMK